ncbi:MAG: LPS biosynthesis choline kinase, partial [Gammaproteobacteria bacterium]|nr:LPS biosynthesis choline kinase [Gammaproteobacteria bacterium]
MNTEVYEALAAIDGFDELMSETLIIKRLGGLTNRNYRVDCERGSFVLRLAGEGTSDYIDRKAELYNATIASNAGVNA